MRPTSAQGGFCEDIPYIFYVGNEGGDLDSIVSSIGAAYIRNRGRGAAIHIPIMCATDPASSGTHAKLHLSASFPLHKRLLCNDRLCCSGGRAETPGCTLTLQAVPAGGLSATDGCENAF